MNKRTKKITRSLRVIVGLLIMLCSGAWAQQAGVLFANDGQFIKIDLTKMAITKKGTLRDIGYFEVFGVTADPRQTITLVSATKFIAKGSFVKPDILVLDNNVQLTGKLSSALESGKYRTAMTSDTNVFVSLYDADTQRNSLLIFDRGSYKKPVERIDGFNLNEYSTIVGNRIYKPMASSFRDIFELDLHDKTIKKSSYEAVGSTQYYSKVVKATKGVIALIVEHKIRPVTENRQSS